MLGEVEKYSESLPMLTNDNIVCVVRQRQGTGQLMLVPRQPPSCYNEPYEKRKEERGGGEGDKGGGTGWNGKRSNPNV